MTRYKILSRTAIGTGGWVEHTGEYEAANDEAAIKAALMSGNGAGDPSGEYVAIPVRSFKPRKVEAKQAYSFS